MPVKYTKKQFNKDLHDLTNLINDFKKQDGGKKQAGGAKQMGGKKKAKRSVVKKDVRTFTIVEVNGVKKPNGQGRYTGQNHSGAAGKACTRACKKAGKNNIIFSLRETTQGSDKQVKKYRCQRTKRQKPIIFKQAGETREIWFDKKCTEITK
jgi:cell division ATPase FtsA